MQRETTSEVRAIKRTARVSRQKIVGKKQPAELRMYMCADRVHLDVYKVVDVIKQFRQVVFGADSVVVASGVCVVPNILQSIPDVTRVIRLVQEIPADDESFVAVSHAVRHTKTW
jgi:hypothetical protein